MKTRNRIKKVIAQVDKLLKPFLRPGESRHTLKERAAESGQRRNGKLLQCTSYGNYNRDRQAARSFVKWCAAVRALTDIANLTADDVHRYVDHRFEQGRAQNTIAADMQGIKRLNLSLLATQRIKVSFIAKGFTVKKANTPRGAYTLAEAQQIVNAVQVKNELAALVLRTQLAGGLRIREAVWLSGDRVNWREGHLTVRGKGGLVRTVSLIDNTVVDQLDDYKYKDFLLRPEHNSRGKQPTAQSWMRTIQKLVHNACKQHRIRCRGTHGFRCLSAILYDRALIDSGVAPDTALDKTARFLGHGRGRYHLLAKYLGQERVEAGLSYRRESYRWPRRDELIHLTDGVPRIASNQLFDL